jgi:hypothetical protein
MEPRPGAGWPGQQRDLPLLRRPVCPEEPIAQAGSPSLAAGALATDNRLETRGVSPVLGNDLDDAATLTQHHPTLSMKPARPRNWVSGAFDPPQIAIELVYSPDTEGHLPLAKNREGPSFRSAPPGVVVEQAAPSHGASRGSEKTTCPQTIPHQMSPGDPDLASRHPRAGSCPDSSGVATIQLVSAASSLGGPPTLLPQHYFGIILSGPLSVSGAGVMQGRPKWGFRRMYEKSHAGLFKPLFCA